MAVDIEGVKMQCLRLAVEVFLKSEGRAGIKDPTSLARDFAGFVLGLEYDEENEEWVEPAFDPNEDADDSELHPHVRAFNDEGQEL